MKKRRIRILLVDDHPLVVEGIRSEFGLLNEFEIVGEAGTAAEAIRMSALLAPDIVVMDINLPDISGLEAGRTILRRQPKVSILILSMHDNSEYARRAIEAGAKGYVLKDASPVDLAAALRAVAHGDTYFSEGISGWISGGREKRSRANSVGPARLSGREEQVLRLLAEGKTNKQIGAILAVSTRTVETHRERIMRKLTIHSLAGLTRYAVSHGLVKSG